KKYLGSATLSNYCSTECRQKAKEQTCLDKYGVSNYACTQEFKDKLAAKKYQIDEKRRNTMLERYGFESISQQQDWLLNSMVDPSKLQNYFLFKSDPLKFLQSEFNILPTIQMISDNIGINKSSVCSWIHKLNLQDYVNINYSSMEVDVEN